MNVNKSEAKNMNQLLAEIKAADQDHEWYPTTNEIIAAMLRDIPLSSYGDRYRNCNGSVLDIGAGNGKVLLALRAGNNTIQNLYAIEKSNLLIQSMPPEILLVGTEFHEQSLLSKKVDLVFCNPPYSEFVRWSEKIIRQCSCAAIYLVIPQRWEGSVEIADAIKFRDAKVKVVGAFDFGDSEDRKARAKVHLLRVELKSGYGHEDDAFERFFKEEFADLINKFENPEEEAKEAKSGTDELVVGPNYPEAIVAIYMAAMARIQNNYRMIGGLDVSLLQEFGVCIPGIQKGLKEKLDSMRSIYWNELFSHLSTVTDRLTSKSRSSLLGVLQKHVQVDFTVSNIYAVIIWLIKNANGYIDSQLIDTYGMMIDKANVQLYKSNKRVFTDQDWRYSDDRARNTHFALDYRIVTHRIGGISTTSYSWEKGLEERAALFLGDLLTVARNLGFNCDTVDSRLLGGRSGWTSGKNEEFYMLANYEVGDRPGKMGVITGKVKLECGAYQYQIGGEWYHQKCIPGKLLFDVKAFKNGNLHLRLNKKFILALNVEHGRLKGWLGSASEAVEELSDPGAADYFKSNVQMLTSAPSLLLK